jgi:hypothetical protein
MLLSNGLFDRLAGRGLDGNTHASLVSLADRLTSNHLGHQTLSVANSGEVGSDSYHLVTRGFEGLLVAQDAPGDPRQFVGQGGCQLVAMEPWSCVPKPYSEAETLPVGRAHQDDVCGLYEQGSEVLAASLGDAAQDRSATCAVLAWHETKPCPKSRPRSNASPVLMAATTAVEIRGQCRERS